MKNATRFVLALPLVSAMALAQGTFEANDENNDGNISRDEWYGSVDDAGIFQDMDENTDGFIDADEYEASESGFELDNWDADGDTRLTVDELKEAWFDAFDDNEDGHWDGDEWDDAGDEGLFDI